MSNNRYTEGVCADGAAILCDGEPLRVGQILEKLNERDQLRARVAEMEDSVANLVSVANSVDRSEDRKAEVSGCVAYAQLEEWCNWLAEMEGPARKSLNRTPAQALAEVRAGALEEWANDWMHDFPDGKPESEVHQAFYSAIQSAFREAARIRAEAEENER